MDGGFTKLYGERLLRSSIWLEPVEVRVLWLFFLASADPDGVVDVPNVKVMAHLANMPLEATERALAVLESPDPGSRSTELGGRRVVREGTHWVVVTHSKYRELRTFKQVRDAKRQTVARALAKCDSDGRVQKVAAEAEADPEANSEADPEREEKSAKTSAPVSSRSDRSAAAAIRSEIAELSARYGQALLERAMNVCASTRKSGMMAPGRWLAFLRNASKYPLDAVEVAMRVFCEKHADGVKAERYLLGIVRGEAKALSNGKSARPDQETLERVKKYYGRLLDGVGSQPSWPDSSLRDADAIARWGSGFGDPKEALSQAFHGFEADEWAKQRGYPISSLAKNIAKYHLAGAAA